MIGVITIGDWGAVAGIVVAALALGTYVGSKVTKYLRKISDRRELDSEIREAFVGTPPNKITGQAGTKPLLIQLTALTVAVTDLTDRFEAHVKAGTA